MILDDVGMLAVTSNRTKLYLLRMAKRELLPAHVVYMEDPSATTPEERALKRQPNDQLTTQIDKEELDLTMSVPDLLDAHAIPFQRVPSLDPNSDLVVKAVAECAQPILIYSGPGGVILRKQIFATGKRLLHTHSGILPQYRGSTTVYYSILNDETCGATAFFMDEQIDTGPVIRKKTYPVPEDRTSIDLFYDPFIRAELLAEVMEEYAQRGEMPLESQDTGAGETYFIIHPVLKHVAILAGHPKNEIR